MPGGGDEGAAGDGETVMDGEGDGDTGDGEADGDTGDGEADGDVAAAEGGGRLGRGESAATWAGMMAARGLCAGEPAPGSAGYRVPGTVAADGDAVGVGEAAARGASLTAGERGPTAPSAKLTATDAASTPDVTPAAVSGRRQRRPEGLAADMAYPAGPAYPASPAGASTLRGAAGSHPGAGCPSFAASSTSSAVGRCAGSLVRQRSTSDRSPAGISLRSGRP
jgi:hypothetical protein